MMRKIKMNLKTAGNIGGEWSAGHNAFMFSLIEGCKLNRLSPAKYIAHILESQSATKGEKDLESLLPFIYTHSLQNKRITRMMGVNPLAGGYVADILMYGDSGCLLSGANELVFSYALN